RIRRGVRFDSSVTLRIVPVIPAFRPAGVPPSFARLNDFQGRPGPPPAGGRTSSIGLGRGPRPRGGPPPAPGVATPAYHPPPPAPPGPPRPAAEPVRPAGWTAPLAAALGPLAYFSLPLLRYCFGEWLKPDYSHGFLVPLFAGYLAWHWRAWAPTDVRWPD